MSDLGLDLTPSIPVSEICASRSLPVAERMDLPRRTALRHAGETDGQEPAPSKSCALSDSFHSVCCQDSVMCASRSLPVAERLTWPRKTFLRRASSGALPQAQLPCDRVCQGEGKVS
jgi:hypothetical protein